MSDSVTQDPGPSGWDGSNLVPDYSITPAPGSWQESALHGQLLSHIYSGLPSISQLDPGYSASQPWWQKAIGVSEGAGRMAGRAIAGTAQNIYQDIAGPLHDPNLLQDRYAQGRLTQGLLATGLSSPELGAEGLPSFPAWHGSGHEWAPEPDAPFGRFDPEKVNTGEATQMEGHGLYVSKSPEAAQYYRGMGLPGSGVFDNGMVSIDGKPITEGHHYSLSTGDADQKAVARALNEYDYTSGNVEEATNNLRETVEHYNGVADDAAREAKAFADEGNVRDAMLSTQISQNHRRIAANHNDAMDWLQNNHARLDWNPKPSGNIYQMWIHPEHEEFLDWDKKLSEQPSGVLDKISNLRDNKGNSLFDWRGLPTEEFVRPDYRTNRYQAMTNKKLGDWTGAELYNNLGIYFGNDADASEYLDSNGIPGNTYIGDDKHQTRNYVVFHPRNVSVIDRNGQRHGFSPVDHNPFEDQPVDLTPK